MAKTLRLPPWRLDLLLAAFACYATIIIQLVDLIFNGLQDANAYAASTLMNGSAVLFAGKGGSQSQSGAFLCICLNTVFLLYNIASTTGNKDIHVDCTYAILCAIAHVMYSVVLLYKEDDLTNNVDVEQEAEKKDDAVADSQIKTEADEGRDVQKLDRNVSFLFGDAFRMDVKNFMPIAIGTVMTYRSLDFSEGLAIIFGMLSVVMGASLLFLIDATQFRNQGVDMDMAWQRLMETLLKAGLFWYSFFIIFSPGNLWWRVTFLVVWFPGMTYILFRHLKLMPRPTIPNLNLTSFLRPTATSPETPTLASGWSAFPSETRRPATFHFQWQKDPDTIERHWLNRQPWIQLSPRTFVLIFVSLVVLGSLASSHPSTEAGDAWKTTGFYLVLAYTLACRGHSPVQDTPELMFVHVKHSFVDWRLSTMALVVTASVHSKLQNPLVGDLVSFLAPIGCVYIVCLILPGVSKSVAISQDEIDTRNKAADERAKDARDNDIDNQTSHPGKAESPAKFLSFQRLQHLDFRILSMGITITILDFILNDELTGWPKTCQVSSFTTVIILILDNTLPSTREIEPSLLYVITVSLFSTFNHFNFLDIFHLFNDGVHDNGDRTLPIKAALYFTLFGWMIIRDRRNNSEVQNEEMSQHCAHKDLFAKSSLLVYIDFQRLGLNYYWRLRNDHVIFTLFMGFVSGWYAQEWPLPLNTTIASIGIFLLVVGFQKSCNRHANVSVNYVLVIALGVSAFVTAVAAAMHRFEVMSRWSSWQVVSTTAFPTYILVMLCASRHSIGNIESSPPTIPIDGSVEGRVMKGPLLPSLKSGNGSEVGRELEQVCLTQS